MYNRSFFLRVPSKFLGVSLFLLFHIGFIQIDVYAQRVIPGDESIIVRHFAQADQLFLKQDSIAAMQEIKALDPLLDSLQTEYPLYSAVVKIWQAWYILVPTTVPVGYLSTRGSPTDRGKGIKNVGFTGSAITAHCLAIP